MLLYDISPLALNNPRMVASVRSVYDTAPVELSYDNEPLALIEFLARCVVKYWLDEPSLISSVS